MKFQVESLEGRILLSTGVGPTPVAPAVEVRRLDAMQQVSANDRFVTRLEGMLLEQPLGVNAHDRLVRALDHGRSRASVVSGLLQGRAGQLDQATNTYERLLGRAPTARELRSAVGLMQGGADQLAVIRKVAASREFFEARGLGSNPGYVEALADKLLGRPPGANEERRWVGLLDRGISRDALVARIIHTPAFVEDTARQIAAQASPGSVNPDLAARVARIVAGDGSLRLTRAKALALGSELHFRTIVTPIVVPPRVRTGPPSVNLPLTPGFSLTTNWSSLSLAPGLLGEIGAIGASPQGTFWLATNQGGLLAYDPSTTNLTTIWGGQATSVSPISDTQAWAIGTVNPGVGPTIIGSVSQKGGLTTVANLPNNDMPAQISASPDGTVWVLGQSGQVYSYAAGTNSWSAVGNGGFTIAQISVGSATNIWASGQSGGNAVVLNWSGGAWSVDPQFNGAKTVAVAAGADGSVWGSASLLTYNFVYLKPPGGSWTLVPNQTTPAAVLQMYATGRDRIIALTADLDRPLYILSYGLVDRPAVPFPKPTPHWDALYADVMQGLAVTAPGGIRALYDSETTNDLLSVWYTKLTTNQIAIPLGVNGDEWGAVLQQLAGEVQDVIGLNDLFKPLNSLNQSLYSVAKGALDLATTNVNLSTKQSGDSATLFIEGLFEAALASVASVVSGGAAVAASFISSAVDNVIADLTGSNNPDPNTKLKQEASQLEGTILNIFTTTGKAYGTQQTTIAKDYGMLSAVGPMVNSGTWTWSDAKGATLAAAAKNAFGLFYYQALMPLAWQIINVPGYLCNLQVCPNIASPDYDTYEVVIINEPNYVQEDVYFINALGASTDRYNNPGPYPLKALIRAIEATGTSKADLFTDTNGWGLTFIAGT